MNLASVLMIAGPQFISAVFFATSEKWKGDSAMYVAGAAISVTTVYTAAYFIFDGAKQSSCAHHGSTAHVIDIVISGRPHREQARAVG
jgi:polyferredoxin